MENLTSVSTIKELLTKNGFQFSKSLGQNFLINPSVCPRMAEESGCEGIGALEIGPGVGVLTTELARRAKKVVAVELDRRLEPVLRETLHEFDNTEVLFGDVLKLDLAALLEDKFAGMEVVVCANLPYYITSPILMRLLEGAFGFKAITVMVQKEAADRLCAELGTRQAGAVTAAVRFYAEPEKLFSVARGSFLPAPNVDSAVIRLTLRVQPPVEVADAAAFFRLVRAAFAQRRKTLPNALSAGLPVSKESIASALDGAGIARTARAEELTLEQFAKLLDGLTPPSKQES